MPINLYLTFRLLDHTRHHPCAEAFTSGRSNDRPISFSPAKNELSIFGPGPRNFNSTLAHRQSTMFGCIGCQFMTDYSNCLRPVWFKHKYGTFDTDARAVALAVWFKLLGDKVMQFSTGPARRNE